MVDFRVLGSLEVVDRGREIPLGGAKQRAVLAILLLHAEEVGLEPGRDLQALQRAILTQDPALDSPAPAGVRENLRQGRRGGIIVALGAALLLVAAAAAVVASGEDEPDPERVDGNSLAVVDPESNRVVTSIPTGVGPTDVAAGAGHVLVAHREGHTAPQITPRD